MSGKFGLSLVPTTVSQYDLLIAGSVPAYPGQHWAAMPSASRILMEPFSLRLRLYGCPLPLLFFFSWTIFLKPCRVDPASHWALCRPFETVLSCFIVINFYSLSREMVHEQKSHNLILPFGRVGFENHVFRPPFRALFFIFWISLFILLYYKAMTLSLDECNFITLLCWITV